MPPELKADAGQPEQWQTLDQWLDTPQFREMMRDEFPEDAPEWLDPVSRRKFLTLMGASMALAGAVGCNPSLKPAASRHAIPYVEQPAAIVPGVPLFFATAMPLAGGIATGLLVKQSEGRPLKVEGNPNHPGSLGGTDLFAQASVLTMYDPDRSKLVTETGVSTSYERFQNAIRSQIEKQLPKKGAGLRIVTEPTTSPSLIAQMGALLAKLPEAKWIQWDAISRDHLRTATTAAFGKPVQPVYHLKDVDVALSLDGDFLADTFPGGVRYAHDFMARRRVRLGEEAQEHGDGVAPEQMNRLYAVESYLSNTGAVADHRLPLKPSEIEGFARALARELGVAGVAEGPALSDLAKKWLAPLAKDLKKAPGKAVVIAGEQQSPAVQQIALAINQAIGAVGKAVTYTDTLNGPTTHSVDALKQLVADMKAKTVDAVILLNVNPVFDAPVDLGFEEALQSVPHRFHLGLYVDETAIRCNWHVNATSYLESWGDCRAYDGTIAIQQPLIAPIYNGKSALDVVSDLAVAAAELAGAGAEGPAPATGDAMEVVRATMQGVFKATGGSGDFDLWWQQAVRSGVVPGTALKPLTGLQAATTGLDTAPAAVASKDYEIQFKADPTLYDGRYANNGWLQEVPKPVTKLTWDNAAIVSPATAEKLKITIAFPLTGGENGRTQTGMVELKIGERKITAAVFILPGHVDDTITLHLGYGRSRAGNTGNDTGFNAYKLRGTDNLWHSGGVEAKKTNESYLLACTQGQYAMESRRPARSATIAQFAADREFAQIPPASAGEFREIRALTPGTVEDFDRLGIEHPYAHDHGLFPHGSPGHDHGHDHGEKAEKKEGEAHEHHGPHDSRLVPLNLYPDNPQIVNGKQASIGYRRWGLAVDLGACTGCSACVVACVAENNIPVVGKDQVTKGRAMHWIRIDRYFSIPGTETMSDKLGARDILGDKRYNASKQSDQITTTFQPVMCQHCEKAPCEVVCPVAATAHSADGLNDMVYNRCVGTRYCSNNCPYKVRRFNFLQYTDYTTESLKLLNNPEVTVRQRGVMEKCSYCVQRIRNAEIEAEREWETRPKDPRTGRPVIRDGEVVAACQAACPSGAIMFGDINDDSSAVLRWKAERHNYGLIAEQNTMPRTSYLAAIRNPNPELVAVLAGTEGA